MKEKPKKMKTIINVIDPMLTAGMKAGIARFAEIGTSTKRIDTRLKMVKTNPEEL
jgi:hypothetical protein